MLEDAPDRPQSDLARLLPVVVSGMNAFSSPFHREMLWWQPFAETPMKGLGMKHGNAPSSRPTCLQIWR